MWRCCSSSFRSPGPDRVVVRHHDPVGVPAPHERRDHLQPTFDGLAAVLGHRAVGQPVHADEEAAGVISAR